MGKSATATHANGTTYHPLTAYESTVRALSDRLVEAQRPIRILDAIKWDDGVERTFFARAGRDLPPVTRDYYRCRPLPFDPGQKLEEFKALEHDVRRRLGEVEGPGPILARMCREYREVVGLLTSRGTPTFGDISGRLYGSASDRSHAGDASLAEFGRRMAGLLDDAAPDAGAEPACDAGQAVAALAERLRHYFGDPAAVRVRLSDGIVADAAAGSDYIKLRGDATFTSRQIRLLEVHEGWVHLGTTPVCTAIRTVSCSFSGSG